MVLYIEQEEEDTEKQEEAPGKAKLPPLTEKEILVLLRLLNDQKFTEPPPRFNEASLIKNLEKYGIGRPSTYAPIINTILVRKYVKLESGRFYPEQIGFTVNDILKENFASVIDVGFTAKMEESLDDIAEGKQQWTKVLQDFYLPFSQTLKQAAVAIKDVSKEEPTSEICPLDGAPLVIRQGPYGKFMACKNFPKCKFTANIDENGQRKAPETTNEICEKCGKPMVVKFGRRGKFLACSGYPACRNTKPMPKKLP
jgi:DNA topoisomerase-1